MSQKQETTASHKQIKPRHFLDLSHVSETELCNILKQARKLKEQHKSGEFSTRGSTDKAGPPSLAGKTLALIFEKESTRTRVSFEVAMKQLGGDVVILDASTTQLTRGETLSDTARVLSRYVDAIMIRTDEHEKLLELAENASVPVINGLTNFSHPCQIMAEIQTFEERLGSVRGQKIAWIGDGNNVSVSWIHAAVRFGFDLHMATPQSLGPDPDVLAWAQAQGVGITVTDNPVNAVEQAAAVVTDVWVSMSDRDDASRHNLLRPYQVNEALMAVARKDAIFMHCLPAHRGEEVTAAVIDGPQSAVFDEVENRLHVQKAILSWCMPFCPDV